ncbi:hypothetical protein ACIQZB_23450 [Streptomyces sp. NPDC097727]|uniref:hypothetical protein n=1 Tax=Streptomyces sp. NPDC097727 TaxID=3366092 RepID=UPI0037FACEAD
MIERVDARQVAQVAEHMADQPPRSLLRIGAGRVARVAMDCGKSGADLTEVSVGVVDRVLQLVQHPDRLPGQGDRVRGPPGGDQSGDGGDRLRGPFAVAARTVGRGRFAGPAHRHGIIAARPSLRQRPYHLHELLSPTPTVDRKKESCDRPVTTLWGIWL